VVTPLHPEPSAGTGTRTKHLPGQRWPACGCQLCMDECICPSAVARAARVVVLVIAFGFAAVAVGSLSSTPVRPSMKLNSGDRSANA